MTKYLTSVDTESRIAQLDTGEQIPITNMLDEDRQDVSDPALCRHGVAGPCADGRWYAFKTTAPDEETPA